MDSCTPEVNSPESWQCECYEYCSGSVAIRPPDDEARYDGWGRACNPLFQCATETRLFCVLFSSTLTSSLSLCRAGFTG